MGFGDTLEIAPPSERRPLIPDSAFRVPRKVFVVVQYYHPPPPVPTDCKDEEEDVFTAGEEAEDEITILGSFTELDLANRCAGNAILGFKVKRLGKTGRDVCIRNDYNMQIRKTLVELDRDQEAFEETVEMNDGSLARVWVTEARVEGPRN